MASPPQKKARTLSDEVASHGDGTSDVEVQQQLKLADLPTSLLVANIFPFLESRSEWNNFSTVNRDIHDGVESHDALIPPWPEKCKLRPRGLYRGLVDPVWSPDGRNIACHDENGRIHIFDQCRGHINKWDPIQDITSLVYSPDGLLLASASGLNCRVMLWDCSNDYQCTHDWPLHQTGTTVKVAFSPDSKLVAVLRTNMISLLRVEDGSVAKSCPLEMALIGNVLFTPCGQSVIFGGGGDTTRGVVKVWRINRSSDALLTVNLTDSIIVRDIATSASGSNIACSGRHIKVWKVDDEGLECIRTFEEPHYCYSVSFTPDENFLAAGFSNGSIRFWNLADGTCSRVYQTSRAVQAIKYSPDGSRLLVQRSCDYLDGVFLKSLRPNKEDGSSEVAQV